METTKLILEAANTVILRDGVTKLTLEAVAREAGVSKGGLLYHYPSKDALIRGLIAHYFAQFEADLARYLAADPVEHGRFARAFVNATFDDAKRELSRRASLFAAVAYNPELLNELRAHFAGYQERTVRDGLEPTHATLLRLAADGLWFAELLQLAPPEKELREALRECLLALTRGPS
jgi:AcrR family transcriptional regulator